jgi:hypothetical protein
MPTVLRSGPYRFFFYSGDGKEPAHVHIEKDAMIAKFWLEPMRLATSGGFSSNEITKIQKILKDNHTLLKEAWNEYFRG